MNDCVKLPSFSEATKEATMQAPTPTPAPAFDLNARIPTNVGSLLITAITPVVHQIIAPLVARIEVLERSLVVADKAAQGNESDLFSRVALLEDKLDNLKDASDERIQEIADDAARMVLSEHTEEYDHDAYDRLEDKLDEKVSEAIDDLDLEDKLRDALRGMTFDITARY